MKRKITLLKNNFWAHGGGAEKYARHLARAFAEKGAEVSVLTSGKQNEYDYPFEVISRPLKSHTSVGKIWEFDKFCRDHLKTHPCDIVFGLDRNRFQTHLRLGSGIHLAFLDHRKNNEPLWKQFRHRLNPLHKTLLHMEKSSFMHPNLEWIFTNSYFVKNELLNYYSVDPKKICVIHNGVEWEDWQKDFDLWQKSKQNDIFTFLFIGNNFERKGLKNLLHGFAKLQDDDIRLLVVGTDKAEHKYQILAQKLHIHHKVTFFGAQKSICPFLQQADCLVIPSFYDPFANVTIEALAMGVFVVTSKTNGGCEVLTKKTGCLIEDLHSAGSICKALQSALKHPKTEQSALEIRTSIKHLDFSMQLDKYIEKCL